MARKLRLGVAGLGRGFMLMLPTLAADPRVELIAAADSRPEARARFVDQFRGWAYESVEALCSNDAIDAIYVATPHQFHARHAITAAAAGKHILVEKPMAVSLAECQAMVDAANAAGVHIVVGHSHSFDAPIIETHKLIRSGKYGRLRLITALNFTDFLYRPRRSEELDTAQGGGVIFSQAAHQIDILRLLGGGVVESVRATVGNWDPDRPTEGAYAAFLTFAGGATATVTYSGYGHFDSDELCDWIGETGLPKDPTRYGITRQQLRQAVGSEAEAALKTARAYGASEEPVAGDAPSERWHEHFGLMLASCEGADLRPTPRGVMIYADAERSLHPLPPPRIARAEVVSELYDAVIFGRSPLHSGEWGMGTLEVCLAILRSAAEQREIRLAAQIAVPVLA